jgi:hypothetical protein
MTVEAKPHSLAWRIPTTGDPRLLKLALAQVGLATIVAALILLVAAPRDWLVPALVGLVPLAVFVSYRRWHRFQRSLVGPANVWLDENGLHWLDAAGQEQRFERSTVTGFRIGIDEDTLRSVPALTLHLAGEFESQPLELYPPATPAAVRDLLSHGWGISERQADLNDRGYDCAVDIYSECHEEDHAWHLEGTPPALAEFAAVIAAAAAELPPPPIGAKPAERTVLCRRREPSRLRLAIAPAPHLAHDRLAAPADVLRELADSIAASVRTASSPADFPLELRLPQRQVWTFHVHVREP